MKYLNKLSSLSSNNNITGYIISFGIGIAIGLRTVPQYIAAPYILLSIICIFFAFQNNIASVLSILPYLIYSEMFMRAYVKSVPYLYLQYLIIGIFMIMFLKKGVKLRMHSRCFIFMILFLFLEIFNSGRSTDPTYVRLLVTNSLALTMIATWASFNVILPPLANRILKNIKYASIYLCGIIIARYLLGDVAFSTHSASEGTNGLAPVQISGYLGFSCSVFFLSIMNSSGRKDLFLNLALLFVTSVVMLLSFSRGGIYFIGVIMLMYFMFNRGQAKSYLSFIVLIPLGMLVYYYVADKTNGLIVERYEQEGSSGRDKLVDAGWTLFTSEPLAGVGTANYNNEIKTNNLYSQESGAHDEFIRAAAEHGIFGIFTYWGFFIFLGLEIFRRKKIQREYALYFLAFFCMITIHNGLKISLQPFILMLAIATPTVIKLKKKLNVTAQKELAM